LDEIPLQARILAIAEAYDAMRYGDLYKDPDHGKDAAAELIAHSGTQFDGEIVEIFIEKVLNRK